MWFRMSEINVEALALGVLVCTVVYSLFSKAIGRSILTLPIIFMVAGLVASDPMEHLASPEILHNSKRFLAEITLILVLFADASHVRFARLKESYLIPLRMLVIGMPLTIFFGTVVVYVFLPEAGWAMAMLTAAILTPTDAALGQPVVSSRDVPNHLSQAINVESGLNDGLALPFVLAGAILASGSMMGTPIEDLPVEILAQVTLGPLVGAVLGWCFAKALDFSRRNDLVAKSAEGIVFLAAAFMSYLCADLVGGNGFISAFVAGAVFGNTFQHGIKFITEFMEGQGHLLEMAAFFVFGALFLPEGLTHMSVAAVAIAVLFLTIVRMGPIWVSLAGSGLPARERLFLGWFGPRGLASILFALIMIDEFEFLNEAELLACVSMTVFLSIVFHGVTANPLAKRIGRNRN